MRSGVLQALHSPVRFAVQVYLLVTSKVPSFAPPGVPLLEIVSEPDMRTGVEAAAYAAELRRIMLFFGITDGNMQARGHL